MGGLSWISIIVGGCLCVFYMWKYAKDEKVLGDLIILECAVCLIFCGIALRFCIEPNSDIQYKHVSYLASSETAVFFEDDAGMVIAIDPDGNEYSQTHAYMFMYDNKGTAHETDDEIIAIWQTVEHFE